MNLILIGMPGAGKSTLGVLLAKTLGMDFIDTDIVIQNHSGRLLQEIIDNSGLESFLKLEEEVLTNLNCQNSVIAPGGSAVYYDGAMAALKSNGIAVYIHVGYGEIERRLGDIKSRGIVIKDGLTLQDVYNERLPLFRKFADAEVDCTELSVEESVREILKAFERVKKGSRA